MADSYILRDIPTYFLTTSVGFCTEKIQPRARGKCFRPFQSTITAATTRRRRTFLLFRRSVKLLYTIDSRVSLYYLSFIRCKLPASNKSPPSPFSVYRKTFTNYTCENFDKMRMIFKAITGSSGQASWWERTACTALYGDGCLTLVWQPWKRYLLWYANVRYIT